MTGLSWSGWTVSSYYIVCRVSLVSCLSCHLSALLLSSVSPVLFLSFLCVCLCLSASMSMSAPCVFCSVLCVRMANQEISGGRSLQYCRAHRSLSRLVSDLLLSCLSVSVSVCVCRYFLTSYIFCLFLSFPYMYCSLFLISSRWENINLFMFFF